MYIATLRRFSRRLPASAGRLGSPDETPRFCARRPRPSTRMCVVLPARADWIAVRRPRGRLPSSPPRENPARPATFLNRSRAAEQICLAPRPAPARRRRAGHHAQARRIARAWRSSGTRGRGTSLDERCCRSRNRRTGGAMRRSAHHGDVHAESTRIRAEPRHRDGRHSFTARNTGRGRSGPVAKRDAARRHARRRDPDRQQRESQRADGLRHRRGEDGGARGPPLRRRGLVEAHRVDFHGPRRPRRTNHAVGRLGRSAPRRGARLHGKRPLARHRLAELRAAGAARAAGQGAGARGAAHR